MSTPPPRLRDTNPAFAQLAAALGRREPDPDVVAKVLAIPDATPPSAPPDIAPARGARSLTRWLVVGVCALTVAGLGWTLGDRAPSKPPAVAPVPEHVPTSETAKLPLAPTASNDPIDAPTISVNDLPGAGQPSTPKPDGVVAPARPNPAASAASTFHEELALIEAARSALGRGDIGACLQTLDRYDVRFRDGVLASEAEITRIEALAKVGQADAARALADRFLERHAASPYAERVRSLRAKLGESQKDLGQ